MDCQYAIMMILKEYMRYEMSNIDNMKTIYPDAYNEYLEKIKLMSGTDLVELIRYAYAPEEEDEFSTKVHNDLMNELYKRMKKLEWFELEVS